MSPSTLWVSASAIAVIPAILLSRQQNRGIRRFHPYEEDLSLPTRTVTAVVLNWSRLPNVVRIASLLCGAVHGLDDTIAQVVIWNNNPNAISYKDFEGTGCPSGKLRLYNSPDNVYFQARFIACSESTTEYCFIQDDDYLVYPDIIRVMRAALEDPLRNSSSGIYLLPPHEHLSSTLRTIHSSPALDSKKPLHTSFAWLGHGALIPRSCAVDFLSLMTHLNASEDEMKMADNFYAILANEMADIWFDHGIELDGGEAFTVGTEGIERNRRYIRKAGDYLDLILADPSANNFPFVNLEVQASTQESVTRTPCLGSSYLLETNIKLLPIDLYDNIVESAVNMLTLEDRNLHILGPIRENFYKNHSPSNAVDGLVETAFCSPEVARNEDFVSINLLSKGSTHWRDLEMVWLVDAGTALILEAVIYEMSADGSTWLCLPSDLACQSTEISVQKPEVTQRVLFHECSLSWSKEGRNASPPFSNPQFVRAKLLVDQEVRWCVYEVWLRTLSQECHMHAHLCQSFIFVPIATPGA